MDRDRNRDKHRHIHINPDRWTTRAKVIARDRDRNFTSTSMTVLKSASHPFWLGPPARFPEVRSTLCNQKALVHLR